MTENLHFCWIYAYDCESSPP